MQSFEIAVGSLEGNAGDDYLDGGPPEGSDDEGFDADQLDGGDGNDTCINAGPSFITACEEGGP